MRVCPPREPYLLNGVPMSPPTSVTSPSAAEPTPQPSPTWGETLRVYLEPASLRMFALGFSAGLPLLLVLGTLSFRLREAGLDRTTIGYLSWVGLAYAFKWCWAPLVDRLPLAVSHPLARAAAQLAAAVAVPHHGLAGGHGVVRSAHRPDHGGVVRTGRGVCLGHARHCAGCVSHRVGRRAPPGCAGRDLPDRLPPGHDLGRCRRVVDRSARRGGAGGRCGRRSAGRAVPAGRLDHGLPGDGGEHAGGRVHRAVLARAGARGVATVEERGRVAAQCAGRAVCRLPQALRQAGGADPRAHRRVPHQRRGDGHHGQPVLCGHGLHQGRGGRGHQGVRRDHDAGGRLHWRRALAQARCHACAHAGRRALGREQPAVCLAGRAWPRRDRAGAGDLGRQPERGRGLGRLHRLPLGPDQRELLGHAVRAVQLHDAAGAQVARGLLGRVRRRLRLPHLLHRHRLPGRAGAAAGLAGFARGAGGPSHLERALRSRFFTPSTTRVHAEPARLAVFRYTLTPHTHDIPAADDRRRRPSGEDGRRVPRPIGLRR